MEASDTALAPGGELDREGARDGAAARFRYHLVAGAVLIYAVALFLIGYPLAIVTGLLATGAMLTFLVVLTAQDVLRGQKN